MPYITQDRRSIFDHHITDLSVFNLTEGDMNYIVTRLCHDWITRQGKKYSVLNAMIGMLECAKLELYRKWVAPYEEEKIKLNGDVQ